MLHGIVCLPAILLFYFPDKEAKNGDKDSEDYVINPTEKKVTF